MEPLLLPLLLLLSGAACQTLLSAVCRALFKVCGLCACCLVAACFEQVSCNFLLILQMLHGPLTRDRPQLNKLEFHCFSRNTGMKLVRQRHCIEENKLLCVYLVMLCREWCEWLRAHCSQGHIRGPSTLLLIAWSLLAELGA